MRNQSSFRQIRAILQNPFHSTCISLFLATTNKQYGDICRHIAMQNSAAGTPVQPTFYAVTNSRQSVNTVAGVVHTITLVIHLHGLKTVNIRTGREQPNIVTNTERRERQQTWYNLGTNYDRVMLEGKF